MYTTHLGISGKDQAALLIILPHSQVTFPAGPGFHFGTKSDNHHFLDNANGLLRSVHYAEDIKV